MINQAGRATPMSISKNCSDRRPQDGFLALGTAPRCKKSVSMTDLSLPAVDPSISDLKSVDLPEAERVLQYVYVIN